MRKLHGLALAAGAAAALAVGWRVLERNPGGSGGGTTTPADAPADGTARQPPRNGPEATPPGNAPAPANDGVGSTVPDAGPAEDLRAALRGGDRTAVRAAAAALRRRARTDPLVRDALGLALLDAAGAPDLRVSLAAILGTLDDPAAQEWLLRAARDAALAPEVLPWVVHALAAKRDWPTDDVFSGMDNPNVVETPGGLQLCVSEPIASPEARDRLRSLLLTARDAAALDALVLALRASVDHEEVRTAFEQRLASEPDRSRTGDLGAALASWALEGGRAHTADRERIGRTLFGMAESPDQDVLRIALQPYVTLLPWPAGQGGRLLSLAQGGADFDRRYWAIELLGRAPERLEAGERAEAERTLGMLARGEAEDKLREKAVAALGGYGVEAGAVLARAAREDRAWHVRLAAVQALGRLADPPPDFASVLEDAAARDADPTVREAAQTLLARRPPR